MSKQRKAVALISGGLDSLLAVRVMQDAGIYVEGINFFTGFCVEGHTHAIRKKDQAKPKRNNALWCAELLGIKLHIIDIVEDYKQVVFNPKHGYGKNLNPCLDCKVFMVGKAKEWMEANDFDFIITGEVVGQRPMSQRKETLPIVQEESGIDDLLVRPLCGQSLPPTKPERDGWIKREDLLDFSGRGRKPQFALAEKFGFEDYAQPAGGCCFLTDKQYAIKLQDLWDTRGSKQYEMDDIMLLKVGRHIRISEKLKIIVAREEGEGNFLRGYRSLYPSLKTTSHGGPLALLDGEFNEQDLTLAARIVARYSQGKTSEEVILDFREKNGDTVEMKVPPLSPADFKSNWLL